MPAKSNVRPITSDHKAKRAPTKRATPRGGGLAEIVDFDAEVAANDKDRKSTKFRLGGFDYTLGKGPNPFAFRNIQVDNDFDISEFIGEYVITSQRKRFIEAIRTGPYNNDDLNLLMKRIAEASAGRPIEAS